MSEEIVFENEWATVRYNADEKYIYHTFHKPITGAGFRNTMNGALDILIQRKGTKWLSDDRRNAEFDPADVGFAITDWGPRAAQGGWKFWALVVPEDVAARSSMSDIVEVFYNLGVRVMVFSKVEEAKAWLIKQ